MRLEIESLDGAKIEVSFSGEECRELLQEAKELLDESNRSIKMAIEKDDCRSLASPSPSVCARCTFRPGCSAYWESRTIVDDDKWPVDVCGVIISYKKLGNGKWLVRLKNSSKQDVTVTLSNSDEWREKLESIQAGQSCAFYSVKHRPGATGAFEETPFTAVYCGLIVSQEEQFS